MQSVNSDCFLLKFEIITSKYGPQHYYVFKSLRELINDLEVGNLIQKDV